MLNGNAGVMKSMVAELTDETNKARGFALLSVAWAVGCTLGFDILLLSLIRWLISEFQGLSLVVCYHGQIGRAHV